MDASRIDGANAAARLWYIILPQIMPVFLMVLTLTLVGGFSVFDIIFIMTGGGPADATDVIGTYAYSSGLRAEPDRLRHHPGPADHRAVGAGRGGPQPAAATALTAGDGRLMATATQPMPAIPAEPAEAAQRGLDPGLRAADGQPGRPAPGADRARRPHHHPGDPGDLHRPEDRRGRARSIRSGCSPRSRWTAWSGPGSTANFNDYLLNSILLSVPSTVLIIVISTMAGYTFARLPFFGRSVLFYLVVLGLLVPFFTYMIPLYFQLRSIGLLDTLLGAILVLTSTGISFGTFFMRAFFSDLPEELEQAARIDGCSEWQIFTRVMLPLVGSGIGALAVFTLPQHLEQLPGAAALPARRRLPAADRRSLQVHRRPVGGHRAAGGRHA